VEKLIGIGAPVNSSDFSYLSKCRKPKLFVHGANDEFGDVERVRRMVASLPGENELTVVDGVDHFFTGKIEELGKAITEWLQPAPRPAR
jgi:alpha/beta superfamily hydrolase